MWILIIGLIVLTAIAMAVGYARNKKIQKKIESGELQAAPEIVEADAECCERGNSFGYNNLVADFRNIPDMLKIAPTVVMDCTHSVQRPGAAGGKTGGNREFVPAMALAAKAFGANGFFFEVHPDPDKGLSDAANMLRLDDLEPLVKSLL